MGVNMAFGPVFVDISSVGLLLGQSVFKTSCPVLSSRVADERTSMYLRSLNNKEHERSTLARQNEDPIVTATSAALDLKTVELNEPISVCVFPVRFSTRSVARLSKRNSTAGETTSKRIWPEASHKTVVSPHGE
jgi:hypothetical protein